MCRLALNVIVAVCVGVGGEGKSGGGEGRIVEDSNCAKKKIDTQKVC